MITSEETWRVVQDWPAYEVSDLGRVRSIDRISFDSRGRLRPYKGKMLKQRLNYGGYFYVELNQLPMKKRKITVHRLVANAFLKPASSPNLVTCHGPLGKLINTPSNLRWDTQSENILESVRDGTHASARKTNCPRGAALVEPNLALADLKRGQRLCKACSRTNNFKRRRRDKGLTLSDEELQVIHDSYLSEIMIHS